MTGRSAPRPALIFLAVLWSPALAAPARADDPPPGTLSGKVVDPDGRAVAGAEVTVSSYVAPREKLERKAKSGEDGRFRVGPLAPGSFVRDLEVEAAGLSTEQTYGRRPITVFPGRDTDLGTIKLIRGPVYAGRVLGPDGAPVAGATIVYNVNRWTGVGSGISSEPGGPVKTDADGRYRTPPLPLGEFSMRAVAPGFRLAGFSGRIAPGGEQGLEPIRLSPGVSLSGTVTDEDGRPLPGLTVFAGLYQYAVSDARGAFTLDGFAPGEETSLRFRNVKAGINLSPVIGGADAVAGGPPVEYRLRGGPAAAPAPAAKVVAGEGASTLSGLVTRNGRPVASGWVGLWNAPELPDSGLTAGVARGRLVGGRSRCLAGAPVVDGAYSIPVPDLLLQPRPRPWRFVVSVEEPGHAPSRFGPFASDRLREHPTVDAECGEGGAIEGRVEGIPDDWRGVLWVVAFNRTGFYDEAPVDRDGRFRFDDLPEGEYALKSGHDGGVHPEVVAVLTDPDVRVRPADPWVNAVRVTVAPKTTVEGVRLEHTPQQPRRVAP